MNSLEEIKKIGINIETKISEFSKDSFIHDINKINQYLDKEVKTIILNLFFQLGKENKVFNYVNKNSIILYIQPKIKNYITFKNMGSAYEYITEELTDKDLYLILDVKNGLISNANIFEE